MVTGTTFVCRLALLGTCLLAASIALAAASQTGTNRLEGSAPSIVAPQVTNAVLDSPGPILTVEVDDGDRAFITIEANYTSTTSLTLVLPFVITKEVDHVPTDAIVAVTTVQTNWEVVFISLPSGGGTLTEKLESDSLIASNGDLRTMRLDFSYQNSPSSLTQILNYPGTLATFNETRVSIAGTYNFIAETPIASIVSGGFRTYLRNDLAQKSGNVLTITYSRKPETDLQVFIFTTGLSILPLLSLVVRGQEIRSKHRLLLVASTVVLAVVVGYSSWRVLSFGLNWDSASVYYGPTLLSLAALLFIGSGASPRKLARRLKDWLGRHLAPKTPAPPAPTSLVNVLRTVAGFTIRTAIHGVWRLVEG